MQRSGRNLCCLTSRTCQYFVGFALYDRQLGVQFVTALLPCAPGGRRMLGLLALVVLVTFGVLGITLGGAQLQRHHGHRCAQGKPQRTTGFGSSRHRPRGHRGCNQGRSLEDDRRLLASGVERGLRPGTHCVKRLRQVVATLLDQLPKTIA